MNEGPDVPRPIRIAAPLGLFALAVVVRSLPWRQVLTDSRIFPFGNDAYYHLRRILYSVVHFPDSLEFDRYVHFPTGAKPIWSPGFDWLLAALARPWIGEVSKGGLERLELFAVWVPPVLGAATVVAAYALARRHFGSVEAVVGGAVLCLVSGHVWYSQIGFVDHHAAVALLSTLAAASTMALLDHHAGGRTLAAGAAGAVTGTVMACAILVWPGALLHLAFLELGLAAALVACPDAAAGRRLAGALAIAHAVAAALVAPFAWGNTWPQWSGMSPVVLTSFQPWLLATEALGLAFATIAWRRYGFGGSRARRVATLVATAASLLGASALVLPELRGALDDSLTWLLRREEFQSVVAESEPLFLRGGEFNPLVAISRFGPFVFVYPFALVALGLRGRRDPARWVFLCWSGGLFAVTLLQRRFFNTSSVGFALVLGVALCLVSRQLAARWPRLPRPLSMLALAGVAYILLVPMTHGYQRQLRNEWTARQGGKLAVPPGFGAALAGVEAAIWLRGETPPTRGWLGRNPAPPEYGVLAPWHLGHIIKYLGRRPTLVDNFGDDVGDNFAWARRYYLATEDEVVEDLERLRVRYVVAQSQSQFLDEKASAGTLLYSLYFLDGSRFEPAPGFSHVASVPALARHRLVYETLGARFNEKDARAAYKIYEVVPGAEVVGAAPPGSRVQASLAFRTNRKRAVKYQTEVVAGPDGRYRLRLPHATQGGPESIRTRSFYVLSCADEVRSYGVREAAVRSGRRLRGPALCGGELTQGSSTPDAGDGNRAIGSSAE